MSDGGHRACRGSGGLFSVGAAATKLTADIYTAGGASSLLTSWSAYVLGAASLLGLGLQQAGFAGGSLPVAMTALVITDPLVSYGLGVIGFGESIPTTAGMLALAVGGGFAVAAGVAILAHSPLLHATGYTASDRQETPANDPRPLQHLPTPQPRREESRPRHPARYRASHNGPGASGGHPTPVGVDSPGGR